MVVIGQPAPANANIPQVAIDLFTYTITRMTEIKKNKKLIVSYNECIFRAKKGSSRKTPAFDERRAKCFSRFRPFYAENDTGPSLCSQNETYSSRIVRETHETDMENVIVGLEPLLYEHRPTISLLVFISDKNMFS